jgi:acetoin utilization deacetylase AcuC-like enzyme
VAAESAERRVVSVLEGGYELHALARSVEAHIKAFMDF